MTYPVLIKAMAKGVGLAANRIQSGTTAPMADNGFAEFHFVAETIDRSRNWDLMTVRIPMARLKAVMTPQDDSRYLELADVIMPGAGPDGMTAAFSYCRHYSATNPKFCRLVDLQREGED